MCRLLQIFVHQKTLSTEQPSTSESLSVIDINKCVTLMFESTYACYSLIISFDLFSLIYIIFLMYTITFDIHIFIITYFVVIEELRLTINTKRFFVSVISITLFYLIE